MRKREAARKLVNQLLYQEGGVSNAVFLHLTGILDDADCDVLMKCIQYNHIGYYLNAEIKW